ncbi:MAG: DUF6057 family protein, partial [Solirubrobacterales bacterium]
GLMANRKSRVKQRPQGNPPTDNPHAESPRQVEPSPRFRPPRSLLFFGFFYLYFAFGIDVRLFYHGCGWVDNFPCFYSGWTFFRGFLTHPGGLVEYLSAFLAQSFFYSWLGAVVMTAQALAFWACTDFILKAFGVRRLRGLRYFIPLLLVGVYCRYGFPFVPTMGLLIALAGACLYLKFTSGRDGRAVVAFLVICLVVYIAAAGAALALVAVCGLYELLVKRRGSLAAICLALGAILPYLVGVLIYGDQIADAYSRLTPVSWELLRYSAFHKVVKAVWVLYLSLPVAASAVGVWRLVLARSDDRPSPAGRAKSPAWIQSVQARVAGRNTPTFALFVVTTAVVLVCRTPDRKDILLVDYFSRQGMWEQVLERGHRSAYQYTICHAVDRALCHLDRLGDDMFQFPQQPDAMLLTSRNVDPLWQKFDACLDLGLVNQAENTLLLCTEIYGDRPLLLHRLATINMIKGNVGAAGVYLRSLAKVPFWRSVADRDLARLERDPDLSDDAEIQRLRSLTIKVDSVREINTLNTLLTENPANRAAYQYSVAFTLLTRDLNGFAGLFSTYHQRNFTRVPRLYEQAIALAQTRGQWPANVPAQTVSPEVVAQLQEFLKLFNQIGPDQAATRSTLQKKFGDTYFYYYFASR